MKNCKIILITILIESAFATFHKNNNNYKYSANRYGKNLNYDKDTKNNYNSEYDTIDKNPHHKGSYNYLNQYNKFIKTKPNHQINSKIRPRNDIYFNQPKVKSQLSNNFLEEDQLIANNYYKNTPRTTGSSSTLYPKETKFENSYQTAKYHSGELNSNFFNPISYIKKTNWRLNNDERIPQEQPNDDWKQDDYISNDDESSPESSELSFDYSDDLNTGIVFEDVSLFEDDEQDTSDYRSIAENEVVFYLDLDDEDLLRSDNSLETDDDSARIYDDYEDDALDIPSNEADTLEKKRNDIFTILSPSPRPHYTNEYFDYYNKNHTRISEIEYSKPSIRPDNDKNYIKYSAELSQNTEKSLNQKLPKNDDTITKEAETILLLPSLLSNLHPEIFSQGIILGDYDYTDLDEVFKSFNENDDSNKKPEDTKITQDSNNNPLGMGLIDWKTDFNTYSVEPGSEILPIITAENNELKKFETENEDSSETANEDSNEISTSTSDVLDQTSEDPDMALNEPSIYDLRSDFNILNSTQKFENEIMEEPSATIVKSKILSNETSSESDDNSRSLNFLVEVKNDSVETETSDADEIQQGYELTTVSIKTISDLLSYKDYDESEKDSFRSETTTTTEATEISSNKIELITTTEKLDDRQANLTISNIESSESENNNHTNNLAGAAAENPLRSLHNFYDSKNEEDIIEKYEENDSSLSEIDFETTTNDANNLKIVETASATLTSYTETPDIILTTKLPETFPIDRTRLDESFATESPLEYNGLAQNIFEMVGISAETHHNEDVTTERITAESNTDFHSRSTTESQISTTEMNNITPNTVHAEDENENNTEENLNQSNSLTKGRKGKSRFLDPFDIFPAILENQLYYNREIDTSNGFSGTDNDNNLAFLERQTPSHTTEVNSIIDLQKIDEHFLTTTAESTFVTTIPDYTITEVITTSEPNIIIPENDITTAPEPDFVAEPTIISHENDMLTTSVHADAIGHDYMFTGPGPVYIGYKNDKLTTPESTTVTGQEHKDEEHLIDTMIGNIDDDLYIDLIPTIIENYRIGIITSDEAVALSKIFKSLWPYIVKEATRDPENEPMDPIIKKILGRPKRKSLFDFNDFNYN